MSDIIKKAGELHNGLKETLSEKAIEAGKVLEEKSTEAKEIAGDFFEHRISDRIEGSSLEAPLLDGEPEVKVWYRVPIEGAHAGDGSGFHIYIKRGVKPDNLCIFFSGGGVAWNEKMATKPATGGRIAAWKPNYYWNNLRPFTQIMNIHTGITEIRDANPFEDWKFAVITYATGDFHLGTSDFLYTDEDGQPKTLMFHGHVNFKKSMDRIVDFFPDAKKLLIAGDSAGAFATPALSPEILDDYYPNVDDVTLFSDSALLLREGWKETITNMWQAPSTIANAVYTDNITADWYENMDKKYSDRCRFLYASSTHDYLLSAFLNEERLGEYGTDEAVQKEYETSLKEMIKRMKGFSDRINFFIFDYRMPLIFGRGGTIHTAVRSPHFYVVNTEGVSMAQWLIGCVYGNVSDHGMKLLFDR